MNLSLAQGQQFASYHANQHGGSGPYPGAVSETVVPRDLVASAHLSPLYKAFDDIKQYGPQSDLTGGGRSFRGGAGFVPWGGRRSASTMKGGSASSFADLKGGSASGFKGGRRSASGFKGGRRSASGFKGGRRSASGFKGGRRSASTMKGGFRGGRRSASGFRGGSREDLSMPMTVAESSKMLIPAQLQAQAGLNPEWKLAENPTSFDPIGK
jgi:hypothetical protein